MAFESLVKTRSNADVIASQNGLLRDFNQASEIIPNFQKTIEGNQAFDEKQRIKKQTDKIRESEKVGAANLIKNVQSPQASANQAQAPQQPENVNQQAAGVGAVNFSPVTQPQAPAQPAPIAPQQQAPAQPQVAEAPAKLSIMDRVKAFIDSPVTEEGSINKVNPTVFDSRVKNIEKLLADGEIDSDVADAYIGNINKAKELKLTQMSNMQDLYQKMETSPMEHKSKQMTLRKAEKENEFEESNMVFKLYSDTLETTGDHGQAAEVASIMAEELEMPPIDFNNPASLQKLQAHAKRAPSNAVEAKQNAEIAKLKKEGDLKIETIGLPEGLFRQEGSGTVYKMQGGQPVAVDQDEIQRYNLEGKNAGASKSTTTFSAGGEKKFNEQMGELDAKSFAGAETKARSAPALYNSAQMIINLTQDGKGIVTGPGSSFVRGFKRLVGGEDDQEVLNNTAILMKEMANQSLQAAAVLLDGQGAVSNNERDLLTKAASGNENLTPGEINSIAKISQKIAQQSVVDFNTMDDEINANYPSQMSKSRKRPLLGKKEEKNKPERIVVSLKDLQ